jgi:PadR family transcriptional regulator, regulatory protein PadR
MPRSRKPSPQTQNLFATMLKQPRAWHFGYQLSKETGLKSGTLYPILRRLRDDGYLISKWDKPPLKGKPPRHSYRLTPNLHSGSEGFDAIRKIRRRRGIESLRDGVTPGARRELLIGHSRLGNLLALLDREEVPEVQRHLIWVGRCQR